ncbi:hypothetical protein D9615_005095 [Tricholomella constricta]|uniref:F-box domain-containing protein n=1 Tax=Tricholomella constricta TaxID=117010 RepID=A0A8H5M764_9AGAR|nr:hypothetical protein D9615_005095 [Tricholomella constricta]
MRSAGMRLADFVSVKKPWTSRSLLIILEMNTFPQELISIIIDNLDDRGSLQSCALVCRSWYAPTRGPLFRVVSISTTKQLSSFHDLLIEFPHLGRLVRDIRFTEIPLASQGDVLAAILRRLKRVESVLIGPSTSEPAVGWYDISGSLRDCLVATLALPTLTSFSINHWKVDPTYGDIQLLLSRGAPLRYVELAITDSPEDIQGDLDFARRLEKQAPQPACPQKVRPESFVCDFAWTRPYHTLEFIDWIQDPNCVLDLSGLQSLTVTSLYDTIDFDAASAMTHMVGASLQHLWLRPHIEVTNALLDLESGTFEIEPVDMSRNTSLQVLDFEFAGTPRSDLLCISPPEGLLSTLSTIKAGTPLKDIFMIFPIHVPENPTLATIRGWDYIGWRHLASFFTGFPGLEQALIVICYTGNMNSELFKDMVMQELEQFKDFLEFKLEKEGEEEWLLGLVPPPFISSLTPDQAIRLWAPPRSKSRDYVPSSQGSNLGSAPPPSRVLPTYTFTETKLPVTSHIPLLTRADDWLDWYSGVQSTIEHTGLWAFVAPDPLPGAFSDPSSIPTFPPFIDFALHSVDSPEFETYQTWWRLDDVVSFIITSRLGGIPRRLLPLEKHDAYGDGHRPALYTEPAHNTDINRCATTNTAPNAIKALNRPTDNTTDRPTIRPNDRRTDQETK